MRRKSVTRVWAIILVLLLAVTSINVPVIAYAAEANDSSLVELDNAEDKLDDDNEVVLEDSVKLSDVDEVQSIPDCSGTLPGGATYDIESNVLIIHEGVINVSSLIRDARRFDWGGSYAQGNYDPSIAAYITRVVFDGDVKAVGNISYMFDGFSYLESIEGLTNFDTSDVTDMSYMFRGCSRLLTIDLRELDISKVKNMEYIFYGCGAQTIDLSNLDMSSVENMRYMFSNCRVLTDLDLSNTNTVSVKDMESMFEWCKALEELDLSDIDTASVINMKQMFLHCEALKELDLRGFNTSSVKYMQDMFYDCKSLIILDVSGFETSSVMNMGGMFSRCKALINVDVSGFDTSNVEDMSAMFMGCQSLRELDVSNFDTSNVTNMYSMFGSPSSFEYGCKWISYLDVSNFDTSNVTNMSNMFGGCWMISELDVSNFDTSKVTDMSSMFSGCESVKSLDVSNFDTSKVTNMNYMFHACRALKDLDLSGFNTSSVKYMQSMFEECRSINDLDLTSFDTSSVVTMKLMFYGCGKGCLDLSSFDTSSLAVSNEGMFSDSRAMAIKLGENFNFKINGDTASMLLPELLNYTQYGLYNARWTRVGGDGKQYTYKELAEEFPNGEITPGTWVWATRNTHKAIFKVGEIVVAEIPFVEGSSTINEPTVPVKQNYIGTWSSYDIKNAKEDIEVLAQYTPIDNSSISEIDTNVSTNYKDSVVNITLKADSTSKEVRVLSENTKPVDVVLVMDQSGSMGDKLGQSQTKRDALVSCANEFAQKLYENAVYTGADHRLALVGFSYSGSGGFANTGLLTTVSGEPKKYSDLTDTDYASALVPIENNGEINNNIVYGINSIVAEGATASDLGLKMAQSIFAENPSDGERERIVVFITDGTPTSWGETPSLIRQTAANSISIANVLKNTQDAKIYCVGVEENANPSADFNQSVDGVVVDRYGNYESYDFNRFLHAVSSNYPSSVAMNNLFVGDKAKGYYMAVNDTSKLSAIFTDIIYSTVYEIRTFENATFSYELSDDFIISLEQEINLRKKLSDEYALSESDISIIRKEDGTTQLCFRNIPVSKKYDSSGVLFYEASVSFEASVASNVAGSVAVGNSGSVSLDNTIGKEFEIPSVVIPEDRTLVVFTINGQPYRVKETVNGACFDNFSCDIAKWSYEGGMEVSGNYCIFEATDILNKYTLCWIIDGNEIIQNYEVGEEIIFPLVPEKEGYVFSGWSPDVPKTMPMHSITCEAHYTPEHDHQWIEKSRRGSCEDGVIVHYECVCGKETEEFREACSHAFVAVIFNSGYNGSIIEKIVCTECGLSKEQNISYKVQTSSGGRTQVLDLSLYKSAEVIELPDHTILMKFYIGDSDKNYKVTRIDADGRRTYYYARAVDGYLEVELDHFSIYTLGEMEGEDEVDPLTYEQCQALLAGEESSNIYSVIFDGNGATAGTMDKQLITENRVAQINDNNYIRTGYEFVSWNTKADGSGTSYADGAEITLGEDITLYAQWKQNQSSGGGSGSGGSGGSGGGGGGGSAKPDKPDTPDTPDEPNEPEQPEEPEQPDEPVVPQSDNLIGVSDDGARAFVKDAVTGNVVEVPYEFTTEGKLYRMYDPNRGEHFYTKNAYEVSVLEQRGWIHEAGSDFTVISATDDNAIPIYRIYNPNEGGMHFYTQDANEARVLSQSGWDYEGISHYVYKNGSSEGTQQYRLYNPYSPTAEHVWTSDLNESRVLQSTGWIDEGPCWRIK